MSEQIDKKPVKKITDAANRAARAESAPAHVRHYRSTLFRVALVIVAVAFGVLTYLVKTMHSFPIDLKITRAVQSINFPPFTVLMNIVSWPGFSPQSIIITVLIILLIVAFGLYWEAVMALIAAVLSIAINLLVKDLVQRPRPASGQVNVFAVLPSYSFPSGHVMFYVGFFGFIVFLAFTLLKPSLKRTFILAFLGTLIILIGISRIYLGEHWASDVLGSYLLGSLTLVIFVEVYLWGKPRFFVHQPVAAAEPNQTQ